MVDRRMLNPGPVNTSSRESSEAAARRYEDQTNNASREMRRILSSLGNIFGDAVFLVTERKLEQVTESAGEALYHYGQALEQKDRENAELRDLLKRSNDGLIMCAQRLLERSARGRRPLPEELHQVACIAAGVSGWDYLFPPDHPNHRHDTNSGGACRNPLCKYHSDNEHYEEPF